jgi:hypothetical protein
VVCGLDLGDLGPFIANFHKYDIRRHSGKVAASRPCRNCRTAENDNMTEMELYETSLWFTLG